MDWFFLILAGLFEVGWAVAMKYSAGFTKLVPSTVTAILMALSVFFLARALKTIPLSTGYAVWTGIGIIGTTLIGMLFLGEPHAYPRLLYIFLIAGAIFALKISS